jgi:hypothetical protein
MTFIIHTKGFDLENELQVFIETCLRMLLRLPVKISEVRVTLGEGDINIGKTKFCRLHLIGGDTSYNIIQYGNSYEEAVLHSVKEMDIKMHK